MQSLWITQAERYGHFMAIMRPGPLAGQLSGRVGGIVFSRNRGGDYVRNGPSPINPSTFYQVEARNALGLASTLWDTIGDPGRASWVSWAQANPVRNRLGESIRLQGNAAMVSLNARLALLGIALASAPPIVGPPSPLLTCTGTFSIATPANFKIAFTGTPLSTNVGLVVVGCKVPSLGISFVKNLLRSFTASPAAEASPFEIGVDFIARFGVPYLGQKIVLRVGCMDFTNGQLSSMIPVEGLAIA